MDIKLTLAVTGENTDLQQEQGFSTLESLGFVRGFTALDQWYLLVNDAWMKTKIPMNEILRDYLVTMLHRYMTDTDLLARLTAFHYFEHLLGQQKVDAPSAHEVADLCLQCVSFFPRRTESRHEMKSYDYVVEIGVSLYQQLSRQSEGKDDWYSLAFRSIADSFGQAVMVLRSTFPEVRMIDHHRSLWELEAEEMATNAQLASAGKTMEQLLPLLFENKKHIASNMKQ